jgi:uncharacterized membrane protein (DUF2068 family)
MDGSGISNSASPKPSTARQDRGIALIAAFKLAKAVLLVAVGLGAIRLLQPGVASHAEHWLSTFASGADRRLTLRILAKLSGVTHSRLQALGIGAFLYAALYTAEGIGLWRGARWAEYLTVIATASFIPFEGYELLRELTPLRVAALVVNVAVVAYLIYRLRHPTRRQANARTSRPRARRSSIAA